MRLVTKINAALAGVVGVSVLLNLGAMRLTVTPSFIDLEHASAERNQTRAREAIDQVLDKVVNSVQDWAFWDDTFLFMRGELPAYLEDNIRPLTFEGLGIDFMMAFDPSGRIFFNRGFIFEDGGIREIQLQWIETIPSRHPFMQALGVRRAESGLIMTSEGLAAVAFAPVLNTDRDLVPAGVLVFAELLDVAELRSTTQVTLDLTPIRGLWDGAPEELIEFDDRVEVRSTLIGVDGAPVALLTSHTDRSISAIGDRAIWSAMALMVLGGALLIAILAVLLNRLAVRRIRRLRGHLVTVAEEGQLRLMPSDGRKDELSEVVETFNSMAAQLEELRDRLRKQDYEHGAADQVAGILHNVRNAIVPATASLWELSRLDEDAAWKQNLRKALAELASRGLGAERERKLAEFVALSADRLLKEGQSRQQELKNLDEILHQIVEVLNEHHGTSEGARAGERVELGPVVRLAAKTVASRSAAAINIEIAELPAVVAHRIPLQQVLTNLLINAAEAIEASGRRTGTIRISATEVVTQGSPAVDLVIADDGKGVSRDHQDKLFQKGFSTKPSGRVGMGLHWSANAVGAMGGRILAESEGEDRGARFHVILPRASAEARQAA